MQEPGNADASVPVVLKLGVAGSDTRTKCRTLQQNCELPAGKVSARP